MAGQHITLHCPGIDKEHTLRGTHLERDTRQVGNCYKDQMWQPACFSAHRILLCFMPLSTYIRLVAIQLGMLGASVVIEKHCKNYQLCNSLGTGPKV